MMKIILGLVILSSVSAFASEQVVRLDKNSIESIKTNVECTQNVPGFPTLYEVKHIISVQTTNGVNIDFTLDAHGSDCDEAKESAMMAQAEKLIYLNSIKTGTLSVIKKKNSVVCANSFLDVAISEEGKLLGSVSGITPVKCP
jgi:hypothetical protein